MPTAEVAYLMPGSYAKRAIVRVSLGWKIASVVSSWAGGPSPTASELRVGDVIHIRGHTTDFSQKVESLEVNHAPATEVGPNADFGLKVVQHASRRATGEARSWGRLEMPMTFRSPGPPRLTCAWAHAGSACGHSWGRP
jgi:hypothetical protein